MDLESLILNNNIKVYSKQNKELNVINIGFYFRNGIAYENLKNNGISHITEHMFFRNLNGIGQQDLYFRMERIGTTLRAKTYSDFVSFDMSVAPKYFVSALEIILNLLADFQWSQQDFEQELKIVKKQIEFAPTDSFGSFVDSNYFKGTKLSKPIMGTIDTVCALTLDDVNCWKRRFFNSNNVCCVLTGGFTDYDLTYFLDKLNRIEKSQVLPTKRNIIFPKDLCKRNYESDLIIETELEITDISVTFDVDYNMDICYVDMINSILGEGVGSKLSLVLREQTALTNEIYSKVDVFPNFGRITIEFSVYNCDVERSLKIFFEELIKFKTMITEKDLLSSIVFFTDNKEMIFDSPSELNFFYGWNGFILQHETNIRNIIEKYNSITVEKLIEVANNILLPENMIITITNNSKLYDSKKLKALMVKLRDDLGGHEHKGTVLLC